MDNHNILDMYIKKSDQGGNTTKDQAEEPYGPNTVGWVKGGV